MNNEYSKVNWKAGRLLKKMKESDLDLIVRVTYEKIKNKSTIEKQLFILESCLAVQYAKKQYVNYFLKDDIFLDFLKNTKIKEENIQDIIKIIPEHKTSDAKFFDGKYTNYVGNGIVSTGIIHSKILKKSILFFISSGDNLGNLFVSDGENVAWTPLYGDKTSRENLYNIDDHGDMLKIAFNLLFYMSAFPENILNRPPDEVCDKLNINNSKTISLSKDIADYLHENRDVSPHLRRGHFRYLSSDRYVNKKGQTVFVKSSFIKGTAKTVIN